jgi:hypothetical protein
MDARSSADLQSQGGANRCQIAQIDVDAAAITEDAVSALTSPTVFQKHNTTGRQCRQPIWTEVPHYWDDAYKCPFY